VGSEENKALVRRYKLEILNGRRLDALGEVASEDYVDHAAFPGQAPGLGGFRQRLELIVRAFDPQWTMLDTVADADRVVVRWILRGVHRAAFLSFAATGAAIELNGIDMYAVKNGKFVEHWNVVDLSPLARVSAATETA
jgi:predicted ester cyclase